MTMVAREIVWSYHTTRSLDVGRTEQLMSQLYTAVLKRRCRHSKQPRHICPIASVWGCKSAILSSDGEQNSVQIILDLEPMDEVPKGVTTNLLICGSRSIVLGGKLIP